MSINNKNTEELCVQNFHCNTKNWYGNSGMENTLKEIKAKALEENWIRIVNVESMVQTGVDFPLTTSVRVWYIANTAEYSDED